MNMKKTILSLIIVLLFLALCACGGGNGEQPESTNEGTDTPVNSQATEQISVSGEGWEETDEDAPFGQYRSIDELRAIIENGEVDKNAIAPMYDETPLTESVGEDQEYSGSEETTTFSEESWEEPGVEFHNDWESMMEEEGYGDMEDFEFPEEYKQYLPEGFDLESLMP